MNTVVNDALKVAEQVDPNAPAIQVAEAVVNTAANPSVGNIVADVDLAIALVKEMKEKLSGAHPSIWQIIKLML